jgi:hypothetical protein
MIFSNMCKTSGRIRIKIGIRMESRIRISIEMIHKTVENEGKMDEENLTI